MSYTETLTALADPTRRDILEALRVAPRSAGELAFGRPISRPAVSQHLRVLERANLVSVRADGTRRVYSLERRGLDDLRAYLESFWSDILDAYGAEVARRMDSQTPRSLQ